MAIKLVDGVVALSKREHAQGEGAEIFVVPETVAAVDPHRNGCYVYAAGHKWDVSHSHTEIIQAIRATRRGR